MKVLSSYPDGLAAPADLNAVLAVLSGSEDWTSRMRRLAARVPCLDIFSQKLVVRGPRGWQLTAAGRAMLDQIEDRPKAVPGASREARDNAQSAQQPEQVGAGAVQPVPTAMQKPQLTLIQGGRPRREDMVSPGTAAVKGVAARP